MSEQYDGWVIQRPDWDYVDACSFRRTRTECIKHRLNGSRWSWRQFKARGWRCIKVRLVPVEVGTAVSQEAS